MVKDMENEMAFRGMVFLLPLVSRECSYNTDPFLHSFLPQGKSSQAP